MPMSQAIGLLGHWLFEPTPIDQRDTVFSWRAFASLHMMFFCVISGRYSSELQRAQKKFTQAILAERMQAEKIEKLDLTEHAHTKSTLVHLA